MMDTRQVNKLTMDMAMFIAGNNPQKKSNLTFWAGTFNDVIGETKKPKAKCERCKKRNSSWTLDYDLFQEECCNSCLLELLLDHLTNMQDAKQP